MPRELNVEILEYGKYFLADGASDYVELAFSPTLEGYYKFFRNVLIFPEISDFNNKVGNISMGLLPFEDGKFLFVQIQSRIENELSEKSPTNRIFNQIRFTQINQAQVYSTLSDGYDAYIPLIYGKENNQARFALKNYKDHSNIIGTQESNIELFLPDNSKYVKWGFQLPYLWGFQNGRIQKNILKTIQSISDLIIFKEQVQIAAPELNIENKILLIEAVQRIVFPKIGVLTFALDNITNQRVNLRFVDQNSIQSNSNVFDYASLSSKLTNGQTFSKHLLNVFMDTSKLKDGWSTANKRLFDPVLESALHNGKRVEEALKVADLNSSINKGHQEGISLNKIIELVDNYEIFFLSLPSLTFNTANIDNISMLPSEKMQIWLTSTKKDKTREKYIDENIDNLFELALNIQKKTPQFIRYLVTEELLSARYSIDNLLDIFSNLMAELPEKENQKILSEILELDNMRLFSIAVRHSIRYGYLISSRDLARFIHMYVQSDKADWILMAVDNIPQSFVNLSASECMHCLSWVRNYEKNDINIRSYELLKTIVDHGQLDQKLINQILFIEIDLLPSWEKKWDIFSTLSKRCVNVPAVPAIFSQNFLDDYISESMGSKWLFILGIGMAYHKQKTLLRLSSNDMSYLINIASTKQSNEIRQAAQRMITILQEETGCSSLEEILTNVINEKHGKVLALSFEKTKTFSKDASPSYKKLIISLFLRIRYHLTKWITNILTGLNNILWMLIILVLLFVLGIIIYLLLSVILQA